MDAELHGGPHDGSIVPGVSESSQVLGFPDGSVYRASERPPYDRLHFFWHRERVPADD